MRPLDGQLHLWSCLASCWYPNIMSDLFEAPLCVCVSLSVYFPGGSSVVDCILQGWNSYSDDLKCEEVSTRIGFTTMSPSTSVSYLLSGPKRLTGTPAGGFVFLFPCFDFVCVCSDVCGVYTHVCVRWCVWCVHICVCALIHVSLEARGGCHVSCSITLWVTSLRVGSLTETDASKSQASSSLWSPTLTSKVMGSQLNPFLF